MRERRGEGRRGEGEGREKERGGEERGRGGEGEGEGGGVSSTLNDPIHFIYMIHTHVLHTPS